MDLELVVDGSAMPSNPGPMAVGMMWHDVEGKVLYGAAHEKLDRGTNNIAEYTAVLRGLELIKEGPLEPDKVTVWCDSQLVVRQMRGVYKVNNATLRGLKHKIISLCRDSQFSVEYRWHRRDADWAPLADALSKGCTQALAIEMWKEVWYSTDIDAELVVDLE